LIFNWLNNRSLEGPDEAVANETVATPAQQAPTPVQPAAQGPVVVTATDAAWVEIKDGAVTLKQGILTANEAFQVPANAAAPTLTTAKPEALRITVGTTVAGPIGEPAKKVTVSLKPDDLLHPRPPLTAGTSPVATAPAAQPAPARQRPPSSTTAPAQQPTAEPAAAPSNSAEPTTNSQ
jgi:hypothetical protein